MVAFNFQERFVPLILSGKKTQTIRRSNRCNVGNKMQLYTGQRTKNCKLIKEVVCVNATPVFLKTKNVLVLGDIGYEDTDDFARKDGFDTYEDLYKWFFDKYKMLDFYGYLYGW